MKESMTGKLPFPFHRDWEQDSLHGLKGAFLTHPSNVQNPVFEHLVVDARGFAKIGDIFPDRKLFNNDLFKTFWPENTGTAFVFKTNLMT